MTRTFTFHATYGEGTIVVRDEPLTRRICVATPCRRTTLTGWIWCEEHAERNLHRLMDDAYDIRPPEPLPELPRWRPGL